MALDLKPFLDGQTGKVTHLADHQGKLATKYHKICFTHGVLELPNSKPTPPSLQSCLKVGDDLHFSAKLTTNPVDGLPTYLATKVWFPNTKSKVDEEPPSQPPTVTAKMLRKSIVKVLKEKGTLTAVQLHSELEYFGAEWRKLYSDTPEGLWNFVSFHKVYFLLTDGRIGLLNGGKPLVQKCIQVIKGLLVPLGSASLGQLYKLLQGCDQDVRNFIFSSKALYSFLEVHSDDFVILPDDTVFPVESGDEKSDNEPSRNVTEVTKRAIVVQCLMRILGDKKHRPMFLNTLLKELKQSMPDVVATQKELLKLLTDYPNIFLVHPNKTVQLIKTDETANGDSTCKTNGKQATSGEHNNALSLKSVAFIKSMLNGKGPLGLDQLMAMVAGAPQEIREHIGDTRNTVTTFLESCNAFRITDEGVLLNDAKTKSTTCNPKKQNTRLRHFVGPVQSIGVQFGFIRHGTCAVDNIFFDAKSYMEPDTELKSVMAIGDLVECLFDKQQTDKRNKYRAVAVWKAPGADAVQSGESSELLALPTLLTFPVYYGEAEVTILAGDVGCCCLHSSDTDSLIEFHEDEKVKPALITFNFGQMQGPPELRVQLKKGARVMFLARKCQISRDSVYPVHGNAISIWPSTMGPQPTASRDSLSVTAEVQELTSEGGRLSFGKDPWAHSITFYWKQIISGTTGLRDKVVQASIGDTFWCIVTSGQMLKDSSKWVATELFPCNLTMEPNPPSRYLSCPAMPLPRQPSFNTTNLKDPGKVEKQLSSSQTKAQHRDMEQSNGEDWQKPEHRESSNSPLSPAVSSDVDLLLDLSPLVFGSNAPTRGTTTPETDVPKLVDGIGKMVSKDNYGGILETDGGDVLKFTAHAFFYQGRPVSHLAFPVGTQVHFDGQFTEGGDMFASTIWIGKRPLPDRSRSFHQ